MKTSYFHTLVLLSILCSGSACFSKKNSSAATSSTSSSTTTDNGGSSSGGSSSGGTSGGSSSGGNGGGSSSPTSFTDATASDFALGTFLGLTRNSTSGEFSAAAFPSTAFPQGFNQTGLVALYQFEDSSGTTFAETSGGPNPQDHALDSNSGQKPQQTSIGVRGKGIQLSNSQSQHNFVPSSNVPSWTELPKSSGGVMDPVTACVWAKFEPTNSQYALIFSYGNTAPNQALYIGAEVVSPTNNRLVIGPYANHLSIDNFWQPKVWKQVCVSYDGAVMKIYGNGSLVLSQNATLQVNPQYFTVGTQIGGYGSHWNGEIDELSLWKRELSSSQILALYNHQKLESPSFTSRIMNFGSNLVSGTFKIQTPIPYGKNLKDNQFDESSSPGGINMSENVLLFHFDESSGSIHESSGTSLAATCSGSNCPTQGAPGVHGKALSFAGSQSQYLTVPQSNLSTHALPSGASPMSVCSWARSSLGNAMSGWTWVFSYGPGSGHDREFFLMGADSSKLSVNGMEVPSFWADSKWKFVCYTYDGANTQKLYTNGTLVATKTDVTLNLNPSQAPINIGCGHYFGNNPSEYWTGDIDELSVWKKELTASEVEKMYLRGVVQFNIQGRICSSSGCSTEQFIGKDGTSSTSFSMADLLGTNGIYSASLPSAFLNLITGSYFQYKIITEPNPLLPEVKLPIVTSVSVER